MNKRMFNKNIAKQCRFCRHARASTLSGGLLCIKRGPVEPDDACGGYSYDPLKRKPLRPVQKKEFKAEDFLL